MRVAPDDDVYRVNAVWLGPRGLTFPWTARYLAYATWLMSFLVILIVEAVVPALHPGVPPVWEICITTLFTYAVMSFVDHERPVRAVWQTFLSDLSAPRAQGKTRSTRVLAKVRVHVRPRHDRRLTRAYFAGTEHTVPTHAARYAATLSGAPVPPQPRSARKVRKQPQAQPAKQPAAAPRSTVPAGRGAGSPRAAQTPAGSPSAAGTTGVETMPRQAKSGRFRGRSATPPRPTASGPDRQGRR